MGKPLLDADMISLESMVAAKESAAYALRTMLATEAAAEWTFWMLVAASISAITSFVMLYYAFRALSTWREQEQLKVKVDFKKSIISMHDLLLKMPDQNLVFLSNIGRNIKSFRAVENPVADTKELKAMYQKQALEEEFAKAEQSWAISEELFIGTKTHEDWVKFKDLYFKYAKLNKPKNGLCELLSTMQSDLVIFQPKLSLKQKLVNSLNMK